MLNHRARPNRGPVAEAHRVMGKLSAGRPCAARPIYRRESSQLGNGTSWGGYAATAAA